MFCKYCGTRLDDVQKFCGVCGRAVDRNIKFADPTAKLLDEVEKSEPEVAEAVEEVIVTPVAEAIEVADEPAEEIAEAEAETPAEPEEVVENEDVVEPEPEVEPELIVPTGLKIGLLVWSIINMAFGMFAFGIPALIMNIRSANKDVSKTKKSISYIKILNFAGSLALALVVFYGIYMSVKHATNL
ncbi:MAG: zinc ribbon domain-containing protein [Clostridia bacterium]|nr:zinc ribbon domain-containing protein [Clostridia bacterium]